MLDGNFWSCVFVAFHGLRAAERIRAHVFGEEGAN